MSYVSVNGLELTYPAPEKKRHRMNKETWVEPARRAEVTMMMTADFPISAQQRFKEMYVTYYGDCHLSTKNIRDI